MAGAFHFGGRIVTIKNYRVPFRKFVLAANDVSEETTVDVYGLSFSDLMVIATGKYGDQLRTAWIEFDAQNRVDGGQRMGFDKIAMKFPDLCASIIALSIRETDEDAIASIRNLPISIQLGILNDVFELSFVGEDSLKKTFGIIRKAMTTAQQAMIAT